MVYIKFKNLTRVLFFREIENFTKKIDSTYLIIFIQLVQIVGT